MQMFPHSFVPFFHVSENAWRAKRIAQDETPPHDINRARTTCKKPVSLDVEKAVYLMISTHTVDNEAARQKCRLEIIKALPSESIDWDSVNWVQICPFKSKRQ